MANLFPVFDVPEVVENDIEKQKYNPSVYFDFEKGDFVRDGAHRMVAADGRTAYMQWCRKMVGTERFTCLAYGTDIGTEMQDAFNKGGHSAVESAVERTITEALMVNPKTEYVRGFEFAWVNAELSVSFIVKGKEFDEQKLRTSMGV